MFVGEMSDIKRRLTRPGHRVVFEAEDAGDSTGTGLLEHASSIGRDAAN